MRLFDLRLLKSSLAALSAASLLAWPMAGCGPSRYVNTTLYGPAQKPQRHTQAMAAPEAGPDALNGTAWADAPLGVQGAFGRDHAGATVTGVVRQFDSAGRMLYQVTYVDGGTPSQAVYFADGRGANEPGEATVRPSARDAVESARRDAAARVVPAPRPTTRDVQ